MSRPPHDGANPPQRDRAGRDDRDVLDHNIAELIRRHTPIEPPPAFRQRLRVAVEHEGRRLRWRRTRVRLGALTAVAALFLVALIVPRALEPSERTRLVVTPTAGPVFVRPFDAAPETNDWRRITTVTEHSEPILVASGATAVQVTHPRAHLDLAPDGMVASDPASASIEHLRGALEVASSRPLTLRTPLARTESVRGHYALTIDPEAPLAPLGKELTMNKKLAAGAVIGVAVLVTITVFNDSDPVDVTPESGDSARHRVEPGQTATVDRNGRVTISDRPDRSSTASNRGSSAESEPTSELESAVAPDQRRLVGVVVDASGVPLADVQVQFESKEQTASQADDPSGGAPPEDPKPEDVAATDVAVTFATARTDDEGAFELRIDRSLASGFVVANKEHFEETRHEWTLPEEEIETEGAEDLAPDSSEATEEPITLTLYTETGIAGRVIDRASGEPLTDYLISYQQYFDAYRRMEPKVISVEDDDGRFHVSPMKPGKYRVWVYHEGHVLGGERRIELSRGQLLEGLDFALDRGLELEVSVFEKESGRPVEGAIVYPHLSHLVGAVNVLDRNEVDPRVRHAGRTGADGGLVISDLPAKKVLVRVLHPDYMPEDVWVTLPAGATERPRIEVPVAQGYGFRGQVLDEAGEPLPGARVIAITLTMNPDLSVLAWDEVDEDGNYHVPNLKPGLYILVRLFPEDEDGADFRVQNSTLTASADTVVDFIESPILATVKGRVVDTRNQPQIGASVTLVRLANDDSGWKIENAATDADGYYEVKNVEFGKYQVGVAPTVGQNFSIVGEVECTEAVDYTFDVEVPDFSVTGKVTDASGEVVAGAEVILMRTNEEQPGQSDFAGRSLTDADGQFEVPGLGAGKYFVVVRAPGYRQKVETGVELGEGLNERAEVDIELEAGGQVEIAVVGPTGEGVPGVKVEILDATGMMLNRGFGTTTDGDGYYSYRSLNPGPHQIRVTPDGGEPKTQDFNAVPGETTRVRITIAP